MTSRTRRDLVASMQRHPSNQLAEVRSLFPQPAPPRCRPEALRLVGPVGSAGMIPVRWQKRMAAVAALFLAVEVGQMIAEQHTTVIVDHAPFVGLSSPVIPRLGAPAPGS